MNSLCITPGKNIELFFDMFETIHTIYVKQDRVPLNKKDKRIA